MPLSPADIARFKGYKYTRPTQSISKGLGVVRDRMAFDEKARAALINEAERQRAAEAAEMLRARQLAEIERHNPVQEGLTEQQNLTNEYRRRLEAEGVIRKRAGTGREGRTLREADRRSQGLLTPAVGRVGAPQAAPQQAPAPHTQVAAAIAGVPPTPQQAQPAAPQQPTKPLYLMPGAAEAFPQPTKPLYLMPGAAEAFPMLKREMTTPPDELGMQKVRDEITAEARESEQFALEGEPGITILDSEGQVSREAAAMGVTAAGLEARLSQLSPEERAAAVEEMQSGPVAPGKFHHDQWGTYIQGGGQGVLEGLKKESQQARKAYSGSGEAIAEAQARVGEEKSAGLEKFGLAELAKEPITAVAENVKEPAQPVAQPAQALVPGMVSPYEQGISELNQGALDVVAGDFRRMGEAGDRDAAEVALMAPEVLQMARGDSKQAEEWMIEMYKVRKMSKRPLHGGRSGGVGMKALRFMNNEIRQTMRHNLRNMDWIPLTRADAANKEALDLISRAEKAHREGKGEEGSFDARLGVGKIVRSIFGAKASDYEQDQIWNGDGAWTKVGNEMNKWFKDGAVQQQFLSKAKAAMELVRTRGKLKMEEIKNKMREPLTTSLSDLRGVSQEVKDNRVEYGLSLINIDSALATQKALEQQERVQERTTSPDDKDFFNDVLP